MTENTTKNREYQEDEGVGAAYAGPHRRSTDLPEDERSGAGGAVRIRRLNWFLAAATLAISAALLLTIESRQSLLEASAGQLPQAMLDSYRALITQQAVLTCLLMAIVLVTLISVSALVLKPVQEFVARIHEHKMLPMHGSSEMQYFAKAYNVMFEDSMRHSEELRYKVEHDHLTGLYNRGAFEKLRDAHENDDVALLLIDVDKFKEVNDTYGHDVGDKVLQKVASLLDANFRSTDYPCRIGGDEFAVIMTGMTPELRQAVLDKIGSAKAGLEDTSDGLPKATLSIGCAFSGQRKDGNTLFKMADTALYRVKEAGRNGCAFYGDAEGET